MRLKVEGWRGITHSYAMVNQYQLLELMTRSGITLTHHDMPFHDARWGELKNTSGFDAARTSAIASIPQPDSPADVTFRIGFPHNAAPDGQARVFAFATCEFERLLPDAMGPMDSASQFITPSRWSKKGLISSGLPPDRIHIVPHGVDPAIFHPPSPAARADMRAWLGISPDQFVFLNVSSVTFNKGIDMLVPVFAQVHRRHPQAVLLLKDQDYLYRISAAGLVEMLGRLRPYEVGPAMGAVRTLSDNLSLADMAALYGAADAYISPYRAEGFNLPPLEAAACGVPVAVTDGGASDDYAQPSFALKIASKPVVHRDLGMLEPNPESLADAMLRLIERRTPQLNMAAGSRWIAENFTWKQAVDKLLAAFAA